MRISGQVSRILVILAVFAASFSSPLSADSVSTIPGIVNTFGLNNTHFVSDVAVTKPGDVAPSGAINLVGSGAPAPQEPSLRASPTLVYPHVVRGFFCSSGL